MKAEFLKITENQHHHAYRKNVSAAGMRFITVSTEAKLTGTSESIDDVTGASAEKENVTKIFLIRKISEKLLFKYVIFYESENVMDRFRIRMKILE